MEIDKQGFCLCLKPHHLAITCYVLSIILLHILKIVPCGLSLKPHSNRGGERFFHAHVAVACLLSPLLGGGKRTKFAGGRREKQNGKILPPQVLVSISDLQCFFLLGITPSEANTASS